MYSLVSKMDRLPIISLQTGEAIAWTRQPVINIATLAVIAFRCESSHHKRPQILLTRDIRQLATDCVIIDNEEELVDPDDVIRLKAALKDGYTPLDKLVVADTGRKLGRVEDYSLNLDTCRIQKLHVRPSLIRAWFSTNLVIDRTQIIDLTPQRITVRDSTAKTPLLSSDPLPEINP